jgi:hypothetical protein
MCDRALCICDGAVTRTLYALSEGGPGTTMKNDVMVHMASW